MKILFCLNYDIYCLYSFNLLLPQIKNHQIKLYFSNQVGKVPSDKNIKILQNKERDLSIDNIGLMARKAGIEIEFDKFKTLKQIQQEFTIFDFKNINQDGLEYLRQNWQPDLIISIRFGQIFKSPIIALPKFGVVNLHSGILPNYRGILATFWAILNKEKNIGATLHYVLDSSIDTGDIISIAKINANYSQSLMANIFKLYPLGVKMIIDFLDKIEAGKKITVIKQDKNLGGYFSYPTEEDVDQFLKLRTTLSM